MDVIIISSQKENIFDFTIDIQGIDKTEGLMAKLIIDVSGVQYGFDAKRTEGNKFSVTIPPLPHVTKSAYPYRIEVVVDGYHFVPVRGTANFEADPFVVASKPKPTDVEVTPAQRNEPAVVAQEQKLPSRPQEKSISQIAKEVLGKAPVTESVEVAPTKKTVKKEEPKKVEKSAEAKKEEIKENKDEALKAALKSMKNSQTPAMAKKEEPKKVAKKKAAKKKVVKETTKNPAVDAEKVDRIKALLDDVKHDIVEEKKVTVAFKKGDVIER